jgi:hypothetical protein
LSDRGWVGEISEFVLNLAALYFSRGGRVRRKKYRLKFRDWPPKRWEIESGHIRISSWVQGDRRRRRRRIPRFTVHIHFFCFFNAL